MQCFPPRTPLWQWIMMILCSVFVFGGIISSGLIMIAELMTNFQISQGLRYLLLVPGAVLSILLLKMFIRWDQDRWHWDLQDDKLIGGRNRDKVFPLSSITSIVPGLPEKMNAVVLTNNTILLKFADGSFIPFNVYRCVNGSDLMAELVERLASRVAYNYEYTSQEVNAFRSGEWNRVKTQRNA